MPESPTVRAQPSIVYLLHTVRCSHHLRLFEAAHIHARTWTANSGHCSEKNIQECWGCLSLVVYPEKQAPKHFSSFHYKAWSLNRTHICPILDFCFHQSRTQSSSSWGLYFPGTVQTSILRTSPSPTSVHQVHAGFPICSHWTILCTSNKEQAMQNTQVPWVSQISISLTEVSH